MAPTIDTPITALDRRLVELETEAEKSENEGDRADDLDGTAVAVRDIIVNMKPQSQRDVAIQLWVARTEIQTVGWSDLERLDHDSCRRALNAVDCVLSFLGETKKPEWWRC